LTCLSCRFRVAWTRGWKSKKNGLAFAQNSALLVDESELMMLIENLENHSNSARFGIHWEEESYESRTASGKAGLSRRSGHS
jgi:hypothetical protein